LGGGKEEYFKINEKSKYELFAAELSALYELSSISFSGSEEELIALAVKKAARLFSVRHLALFAGPKANRQLIASWGFRNPDHIAIKMDQDAPNQFYFSSEQPISKYQMKLFLEQANPISNREHRLYTIFARRLEEALLIARSIKERERAEEALRESERRYRLLADNVTDVIWVRDMNLRLTYISPSVEKMMGYTVEEAKAITLDQNLTPESFQHVSNVFLEELEIERQDQKDLFRSRTIEAEVIRKDGSTFWIEAIMTFLRDQNGNATSVIGITRDITERRQLEEQLQKAQKMRAISTLAGGIAHEFNNALSVVMSSLDMLEVERPGDEIMSKYAELIKSSSLRMSKLTRQLLAYARGGKYKPEITSLVDFIDITLPIIQHIVPSEIRISTILSDAVDKIEVDITQMQMALSAIVTNAVEAIEGKGCISISSGEKKVDWELVRQHHDAASGRYVYVAIEDNGKGMDKRTVDLLFEPFFTTKFQGRGLGMAAAYGIVKNHNGFIEIDSQPEKGTVVSINLPTVETETTDSKEPKVELVEGTGTILVVEDEEIIMDICRTILERLGYHVLEAKTGREAVDLVKRFDGAIDGVLLDVGLPDMKGETVYEQLMAVRPHLKCVVCTGYAVDDPYLEVLIDKAHGFIQKPYSLANLSATLKAVLTMEQGMDE
jgi:PAS domain S-box-containing protein